MCKLDINKLKLLKDKDENLECNNNLSTTSTVSIDDTHNESEKHSQGIKGKTTSSLNRNMNDITKDDSMIDNNICSVRNLKFVS